MPSRRGWASNCERNAERRLASASCVQIPFLLATNLSNSIFGDDLGVPQALARTVDPT